MGYYCYKCCKEKDTEWCDDCRLVVDCNCSSIIGTRFKDLTINCTDGERTVRIWIYHCETCGEVSHIE